MRPMTTLLATAVLTLTGLGHAEADYLNFTFLGAGISGAGVVTVKANATGGGYTALTGTMDVLGDTAVRTGNLVANPNGTGVSYPPGIPAYYGAYDDQIFPGSSQLVDSNGLFFVSGVHDIFIFNGGTTTSPIYAYFDYNTQSGSYFEPYPLQFLVSAVQSGVPPTIPAIGVPEPSSLALCGVAGLIGMASPRLRRRRLAS